MTYITVKKIGNCSIVVKADSKAIYYYITLFYSTLDDEDEALWFATKHQSPVEYEGMW